MSDTTITSYLDATYFAEKQIEVATQNLYKHKVFKFGTYLCRTPLLSDLNRETLNRYLGYRLATVSANTARGDRATLLAIWNYAVEAGDIEQPPTRVKPIRKVLKQVEGWDRDQRAALLAEIEKLDGTFQGKDVGKREFWKAVVLTLYDTGLRISDLFNLDAAQLRGEGVVRVIQKKTKRSVDVQIGPEAWDAIKAINPRTRKKPFGDVLCRRWFFLRFAEICDAAGLDGRARKLRITCGSEIERDNPGCGHLYLGNGRSVFEAHYLAAHLANRQIPRPPKFS